MSWQKYPVATAFILVLSGLNGCSDAAKKYRDTSELELPPQLEIGVAKAEQAIESGSEAEKRSIKQSLKDLMSLADESNLIVNRPFDTAWQIIEKTVLLADMEISDRNRDKGLLYVVFDPDNAEKKGKDSGNWLTDLFSTDNYPKARYLLTFYESPKSVKIKVEFLEYTESKHSAQDGYAETTPSDTGVEKLLKKLYSVLHDDLLAE